MSITTQFTNGQNPSIQSEVAPDLMEWMGRAVGDAVEHAKPRLDTLIQALPAAIYTTDAAGRITFFNEAAAELWGRRPRDRNERVLRLFEVVLARR